MDKSKLNSLLAWMNSTGAGRCLESLEELYDGSHFIELIRRVNGDENGTAYCDTPVQRYRHIEAFVIDFYKIKNILNSPFSHEDIIKKRNIGDIAKLTALMMCACCIGSHNEHFVLGIDKLDKSVQGDIMAIIQHIVLQDEQDDISLADNFVDILYKPGSQMSIGNLQTPLCLNFGSVSSTPSSVFTPSTPMSPVRAFISSPQVKQKIMARKRYEDFRKIESRLATEKALRLDQESEIAEKNNTIKSQNEQLLSLQQEVHKLRKQEGQMQSMRDAGEELRNQMEVNERLEKRLADMEGIKRDRDRLQGVIDRCTEENAQLRSQMHDYEYLKGSNKTMEGKLRENEGELVNLNACLQQYKEAHHAEQQRSEMMKTNYEEMQAIYNSKMEEFRDKLSNQSGDERNLNSGESLAIVSEMKQFELEEKIQRLQNNVDSISAEKEHMEARLTQENKRLTGILTQAKEELQGTKQAMEILEKEFRGKVDEIVKVETAMQELDERKTNEMAEMKAQYEDVTRRMHAEGVSLKQRLAQQVEEGEKLKDGLKQLEIAKKEEMEQLMTSHRDGIESLEQRAKCMEEELTKQLMETERKRQELEGLVAKKTEVIKELESEHMNRILQLKDEEQSLKEKLDSQAQIIEMMKQTEQQMVEKFQMENSAFLEQLETKTAEASGISVQLEHIVEERNSLEKQLEMKAEQFEKRQLEFSAMEEQKRAEIIKLVVDHNEIRVTLETEVACVKGELGKVNGEYEKSKLEMKDLEERMTQQRNQLVSEHQHTLEQMEENLRNKLAKRDDEKAQLKDELKQLEESKIAEINKLAESYNDAAMRMEEQNSSLKEELRTQIAEVEKTRTELQRLEKAREAEVSKLVADHLAAVDALKREKEHLVEELKVKVSEVELIRIENAKTGETKLEEISKIMEDHKDTVNRLMSEKGKLECQLNDKEQVTKQMMVEYQECRDRWEAERSHILQESNDLSTRYTDLEQKLNQVTSEAGLQKERIKECEARIEECEQTIADAIGLEQLRAEEMEQRKTCHQEKVKKMESEKADLEVELAQQMTVCDQLKENMTELEISKTSEIKEILECHEEEMTKMKLEREMVENDLQKEVCVVQHLKQEMKEMEDAMRAEMNELKTGHDENMKKMEEERDAFERAFETQVSAIQEMMIDGENKHKEFELEKCTLLQGKDSERNKFQQDIKRMQADKVLLENQVVAKQAEVDSMRAEMNKLKTGHDENVKKMAEEREQIERALDTQVEAIRLMMVDGANKHKEFEVEKCTLLQGKDSERNQFQQDIKRMQADKVLLETQVVARTAEVDKLKIEIGQYEERSKLQSNQGEEILQKAKEEVQHLKEAVDKKDAELGQYQSRCQDLVNEKQQLAGQLNSSVDQVRRITEERNRIEEELEVQNSAVHQMRSEMNVLMTRHEEHMKRTEEDRNEFENKFQMQLSAVQQMIVERENKDKEYETERCTLLQGKDSELVQLQQDIKQMQADKVLLENQVVARTAEVDKLKMEIGQYEERSRLQSNQRDETLRNAQEEVQHLKETVDKKDAEIGQHQTRCQNLESENQQLAGQLESNAVEVEKLRKEANDWITEKNKEISRSAVTSEKLMVAVKERESMIQNMERKLYKKDEEIMSRMKEKERLMEEKAVMERQLQEHTQAFEQEMKAIQTKLTGMTSKQDEKSGLEVRVQKLSKDKGAVEAKLQRLLASQDKRKKERVQMEKQLNLVSEMKDEAVSKADEVRKENEVMRIEIRSLEAKLHQAEEEVRVSRASHFENFSGVEFVQSMDSIANDSLEGELSPDDLNVSKISTGSNKSASGFSLSLPRGHKLQITYNKSDKKRSKSRSRNNTPVDCTPTNVTTPTLSADSFKGSFDSLTSFQQPSFSSLRSSRRASLRSQNSRRESILPVMVDNTIDELAQTQSSFLRSSARQQSIRSSRQTTARSGFVVVHDCDDEPDLDFDWNRLSELQRRNTLCLPHQKTSYPVEVQMRAPTELSEDELQKGLESPGVQTRAKKRRGPEPETSTTIKVRAGNRREQMPPPDLMPPPSAHSHAPKRRQAPSVSDMSFAPSTNFAPVMSSDEDFNRRESVAFSVGFSPKQQRRRSRKPLMSKNSTEKKKADKVTPKKPKTPKRRGTPKRGTPKRGTPKRDTPKKKKGDKVDGKRRKSFFFGK